MRGHDISPQKTDRSNREPSVSLDVLHDHSEQLMITNQHTECHSQPHVSTLNILSSSTVHYTHYYFGALTLLDAM